MDRARFYHYLCFNGNFVSPDVLIKYLEQAVADSSDDTKRTLTYFCYDFIIECIDKKFVSL